MFAIASVRREALAFQFCLSIIGAVLVQGQSADRSLLQSWLDKPLLATDQTLLETQAFTERQVLSVRSFKAKEAWIQYAQTLRKEIQDEVVFRGVAADWRGGQTRVEWLDTLPGGGGYRIRKLRYEAVPGLWIPALLYEPESLTGKVPAVLNVNGHDREGKAASYKQIRCINQAKRGLLALNTEWLGMGQLSGTNYAHYRMNQLDLCGTSGLAPFYLAMKRALDILLDHPHADPQRIAVAGLSGGGWQTIFISALDERVRLANPVAGYSSFRTRARHLEDLGDSEQTPCDLADWADYTHLTALLAPRPALLTFNAKDNCCFAADHALPPLLSAARPVYQLFSREDRLRTHVNHDPGDHNFGEDNRSAFYRMLRDFFYDADPDFPVADLPTDGELKSAKELRVPLPEGNATFHSLALNLAQPLPRNPALPQTASESHKWQETNRARLDELIRARPYRAVAQPTPVVESAAWKARFWQLTLRKDWTLPVVEIAPAFPKATALVIHDGGRTQTAEQVSELLKKDYRVLALDLFYFGECKITRRDYLFALLLASIGERPLGLQSSQLNAIANWAKRRYPNSPTSVHAFGPRSSLIALVAGAAHSQAISALELHGSLGSLKEVVEKNWSVNRRPEWFCFGLLEAFDIPQLTALAAPRPVTFHQASQRLRENLKALPQWYKQLDHPFNPTP